MSAEVLIASYLRIANEDLAGARQLATTGNRNAMYLCSQAGYSRLSWRSPPGHAGSSPTSAWRRTMAWNA